MKDPNPENITGSKSVQHVVEHSIRWDYFMLGIVALYAIYRASGWIGTETATDQEENNDLGEMTEIVVEDQDNTQGLGF